MKSRDNGAALLLALLIPLLAWAQRDDSSQPINIQADRATYEAGRGVYEGNVVIEQGAMSIRADRVVVFEADRTVDRLIAHGTPARFRQTGSEAEAVKASADTIDYHVASEQIILQHNASVDHQGSEIHGERIVYNSRDGTVNAEGDAGSEEGRVRMILQPRQREQTAQTEPTDNKSEANADSESP